MRGYQPFLSNFFFSFFFCLFFAGCKTSPSVSPSYSFRIYPLKYHSLDLSPANSSTRGWTSLCQPYYVSYESCLLLLHSSPSCRAAYYVHKMCHLLHDDIHTFEKGHQLNSEYIDSVYITKSTSSQSPPSSLSSQSSSSSSSPENELNSETSFSSSNSHIQTVTATESYQQCLASNPPYYVPPSNFDQLPKLTIVISASLSWKSKGLDEFNRAIDHWRCYAKIHNYNFTLNIIPAKNPSDFFFSRHESIQTSHLPYSQYILHLDADSVVLNVSRSLDPFLSLNSSVIFYEKILKASGIYIVRNDLQGYCFLDYWRRFHPPRTSEGDIIAVPNYDNGALVASLLHLIVPGPQLARCFRSHYSPNSDYRLFIQNKQTSQTTTIPLSPYLAYYNLTNSKQFQTLDNETIALFDSYPPSSSQVIEVTHHDYSYPEHACLHEYIEYIYTLGTSSPSTLLPSLQQKTGVYVLWSQEGLWRSHEKEQSEPKIWYTERFRTCFPTNDLIGHGDKLIATHLYYPPHYDQCDLSFATNGSSPLPSPLLLASLSLSLHHLGKGANPKCKWYDTQFASIHTNSTITKVNSSLDQHHQPHHQSITQFFDFELRTLRKYCYFSSPKCLKWLPSTPSQPSTRTRENICVPSYSLFPKRIKINHCTPLRSQPNLYLYNLQKWRQEINYSLY